MTALSSNPKPRDFMALKAGQRDEFTVLVARHHDLHDTAIDLGFLQQSHDLPVLNVAKGLIHAYFVHAGIQTHTNAALDLASSQECEPLGPEKFTIRDEDTPALRGHDLEQSGDEPFTRCLLLPP